MIKTINSLEEVIDFAWKLSQDNLHASYPRRESMKVIKEDIERAISGDNENVIACYHHDVLCGLCIYFWKIDEKYAQTTEFIIMGDYDQIANEFIDYLSNHLARYQLLIGVPITNKNANHYFKKKNIECIEASIVTRIRNLEPHTTPKYDYIEEINKNNFEEYVEFHDKYAIPARIYFNSENLRKKIERFRIFAFRQDGGIHGSIFVSASKDISDVVGLFIDEEYKNNGIESILINEMLTQLYNEFGAIKEILYFVDEDSNDELKLVLTAGFEIKEKYRCYKSVL